MDAVIAAALDGAGREALIADVLRPPEQHIGRLETMVDRLADGARRPAQRTYVLVTEERLQPPVVWPARSAYTPDVTVA